MSEQAADRLVVPPRRYSIDNAHFEDEVIRALQAFCYETKILLAPAAGVDFTPFDPIEFCDNQSIDGAVVVVNDTHGRQYVFAIDPDEDVDGGTLIEVNYLGWHPANVDLNQYTRQRRAINSQ